MQLASRSLCRRAIAVVRDPRKISGIRTISGVSWHSTDASRLNEDNMVEHHVDHGTDLTAMEWEMFHGKIPVLKPHEEASKKGMPAYAGETPRTSVLMELTDRVGVLHDVLRYFWKYDINVSRIESRPVQAGHSGQKRFDFFVDFDGSRGEEKIENLLDALEPLTDKLLILDEKKVSLHAMWKSEILDLL